MKIAIVATAAWYIANFRGNLIRALRQDGHDMLAISAVDRHVADIERAGARHLGVKFSRTSVNPWSELRTVLAVRRVLVAEKVDVVLSYTPKGNIYAALAMTGLKGAMLPNVSGLGRAFARPGLLRSLARVLYRLSLRNARHVFFQNREDLDLFLREGLVDEMKTQVLPGSGVDLRHFRPMPAQAEAARTARGGAVRFLLLARLLWDKGVGEFVEAARQVRAAVPGTQFHLLGFVDAPAPAAVPESTLREWAAEGVIEYLGASDDVRPHLSAADCVVLPSVYREGVPRSLLEAAAMGKPLITTDSIGCRDTVEDGVNGLLCVGRDAADLSRKMMQFLALSAPERELMGQRGRERMELRFDEAIIIKAYRERLARLAPPLSARA
jgi:glycosyltransferase involved in cell wall biosynthesis